jgi:hypothetical protein
MLAGVYDRETASADEPRRIPMASALTFPDALVDDPTPAAIGERRAGAGIAEDLEPGRGLEIVDNIGTFAEAVPVADATGFDSVPADVPVGSWFG